MTSEQTGHTHTHTQTAFGFIYIDFNKYTFLTERLFYLGWGAKIDIFLGYFVNDIIGKLMHIGDF